MQALPIQDFFRPDPSGDYESFTRFLIHIGFRTIINLAYQKFPRICGSYREFWGATAIGCLATMSTILG